MKRLILFLLAAQPFVLAAAPPAPEKLVYLQSELAAFLKKSANDSVLRIERRAAIEFHKIINKYRRENGKDSLAWNDTLWISARNHCAWMAANNELSHHQKANTKAFTGWTPGDRYVYVTSGKGRFSWSGENALYNWSGSSTGKWVETAKNIAKISFEQWKNSPGHNSNMLAEGSKCHGVAFIIDPEKNSRVWATDLFTYQGGSYREMKQSNPPVADNTTKPGDDTVVLRLDNSNTATVQPSKKKTSITQVKNDLGEWASKMNAENGDKILVKASLAHATYLGNARTLAQTKDVNSEKKGRTGFTGESPRDRVMAASKGLKKIRYRKHQYDEEVVVVEMEAADYNEDELIKKLEEKLASSGNENLRHGIGFDVRKTKSVYRVVAVRVKQK